jgi:endonuclease/exonuclease/phosphatase family metal-dependent hydrolase
MRNPLALLLSLAALLGCSTPLGQVHPWVPWEQIGDWSRPEVAPLPMGDGLPATAPEATSPATLRLVTFNVEYGEDVSGLARAFQENAALAQADVILLQEIRSFPEEGSSRASRLAAALGMGYVYAAARSIGTGTHGLAILSRLPFDGVAVMELPHADLPTGSERRIALTVTVHTGAGPLQLIDVHLDTRLNVADRLLQLRPAVIDAPTRVVVAGDFNTNPMLWAFNLMPLMPLQALGKESQAVALNEYMDSLGFDNTTADFGPTATFPLVAPKLDSIYTRDVTSVPGGVERSVRLSDHWPVWVDLTLP